MEITKETLILLGIDELEELTVLVWEERRRRYGV